MTLAYDTERMRIALATVADAADALLRTHAARLAEWQVQRLAHIRAETRSLLAEMNNEEAKEGEAK